MSTRSLRNKIEKIEATLPPPAPPYSKLPIEEWVADELGLTPPDWYLQNSTNEERFYEWLEGIPKQLTFSLHIRLVRARREKWDLADPIRPLPPEVDRRVGDVLPLHIERRRQLWAANYRSRERRRRWVAEMDKLYPRVKTRANGYGWWLDTQENYARLREKYSGFGEEWAEFYEEWKEKCEREGGNVPMYERMRAAFIHVCFLRGEYDREVAGCRS